MARWEDNIVKKIYQILCNMIWLQRAMVFCNRSIVLFMASYYLLQAGYFIAIRNVKVIRFLLIPGGVLISISILRSWFPRKRPFAAIGFRPLLLHETGNSFPSRHTASAAVIGMAACYALGLEEGVEILLALVPAMILGALRVAAGVHYPTDVLFAFLWGAGIGGIGFFYC